MRRRGWRCCERAQGVAELPVDRRRCGDQDHAVALAHRGERPAELDPGVGIDVLGDQDHQLLAGRPRGRRRQVAQVGVGLGRHVNPR